MSDHLNIYAELLAARDHLDAILGQVTPEDFPKSPSLFLHRLQLERVAGRTVRRSCLCGGWEWLGDAGPASADSFRRHLAEDRDRRQHAARLVHVTVPQDGTQALATWDKIQAALKDAGVTVTQGAWRPPWTGDTHVSGPDLDVPDTPEGRKLWQEVTAFVPVPAVRAEERQDQFQAEEAEEARQAAEHAPFQPHTVRRASDLESGGSALVCSCGKWKGPRAAMPATVLNSYGAHLREVWGC